MLIVCPGSVGCPAYIDNNGSGHVIETGSPHARYAVIERQAAGWSVEQIALPYDTPFRGQKSGCQRPPRLGDRPAHRFHACGRRNSQLSGNVNRENTAPRFETGG